MPTPTVKNSSSGPVLSHIEVVSIYLNIDINGIPSGDWGSLKMEGSALPLASELDLFLDDILGSEYMDPLAEYSVGTQGDGTPDTIGRGRKILSRFLTARDPTGRAFNPLPNSPNLVGTSPTPKEIQEFLDSNAMHVVPWLMATIRAGTLPPPRPNLCYFVFLPPGVSAERSVGGDHASFQMPGFSEVYYAVIVHPQSAQPLNPRTTPEDFHDLTFITSHELAEAVTDPQVVIIDVPHAGAQSPRGTGWHTDEPPPSGIDFPPDCNREIADLCESRRPIFHGYQVSDFWSEQRHQGVLCPIQIRLNNGVCFAGGGTDAGGAIEGQTAHFSVNVPCILPGVGLAYRWAVSGASTPMETQQPDFIVTMPPAPNTVTITVTVSTNGFNPGCIQFPPFDGDVSAEATYRSITIQEAEDFTFLCEFYSRIIKYVHVNIFVNPLWDPLRDFSLTPLLGHEVREMHQIAVQLSRLTGRLLHLSEVGLEQGTEVEHPRAEP